MRSEDNIHPIGGIISNAKNKSGDMAPSPEEIHPSGTLIAGRYEVVEGPREKKHYQGGMGLVYFCRDRAKDQPVALKTFQPQYLSNRTVRDLFLRESTLWVELGQHPFLVQAHGVLHSSLDCRELYVILDYIAPGEGKAGASLREWLRPEKPPLPLAQSLTWMWELAHGLAYAAEKKPGFVHRDLKPENILIGRDGHARVTDLGLARCLSLDTFPVEVRASDESSATSDDIAVQRTCFTRHAIGTPLYMAPEQWQATADLDVRTDIYAWGCVLLELLTGQWPVRGKTQDELERGHATGHVWQAAQHLPAGGRDLVATCVAVNRTDRFPTWRELLTELERVFSTLTHTSVPQVPRSQDATKTQRVAKGWSLNGLGNSYMDIGKPKVALGYFEKVITMGKAEQDQELQRAGLGNQGNAYRELGELQRAIPYHEKALALAQGRSNRVAEGVALANLGAAYYDLGELQQAISYFEQTLTLAQERSDRVVEGRTLSQLGAAIAKRGEPQRAISYFEQALALAKKRGHQWDEEAALHNLGSAYRDLGEPQRAIPYFEQRLAIARKICDLAGEAKTNFNLALSWWDLGRLSQAQLHAEAALGGFTQVGHTSDAQDAQQLLDQLQEMAD